jgi:two-component system sensor histidine kinase GlrK
MRLSYPKSFLSLLLIGFSLVVLPLVFALFANAISFEKLAGQSEQAVHGAVKVTKSSRQLAAMVTSLERSARQYAVAGDATFFEAYRTNRAAFLAAVRQLQEYPLSDEQKGEVATIVTQESTVFARLLQPSPELGNHLAADFAVLSNRAQSLVRASDLAIDEEIGLLRNAAVKARNRVFWQMIATIPIAILLIAGFTFLIAQPIRQVSEGIRMLGEGQFGQGIAVEGPEDMVRLGEQLDWLRQRLVTLEEQKARFLQHISHELKTPLTALREGSDLLSSGVVGNLNAEQLEIARILQENSIELRKLIEGLLNYSAVHAQASYLDAKIVQLRDIVRRVVSDRKLALVAKGMRIELNCENVSAYADEEKIRVMLDNLLSNAIKYSPERGLIAIKLYKDQRDAVLEMRDEGPGIPPPEREKVFDIFYRGTDAPVSTIKGSGLGLSIVKEYVQLHKGEVEILDGPGAHFRIRFPRKKDLEEAA